MQQEVIQLQQRAVDELVHKLKGNKQTLTFKSPTGSGKTFMMAGLMNKILSENEKDDIIFLVSTLSKGELAKQNYEKFCQYKEQGIFFGSAPKDDRGSIAL